MSVRFKNERVVRAPNECTPQNSQTKKVTSNAQIKNHPEDFVLAGGADRLQFNLLCGDWTKKLAWHEPERGRENGIFRLVSSSRDRPANRCSGTNNRELQTGRRIGSRFRYGQSRCQRGQDFWHSIGPLAHIRRGPANQWPSGA